MTDLSGDDWPPHFTLDRERILNLLTGDRFYSNSSAALREAVLNAIDAVNRRLLIDPDLTPSITVRFNHDCLSMTVSDNGDGMNQSTMADLFTRIGASAADLQPDLGSVGEFGIGVISYFMAGDSFSVQTFDGSSAPLGVVFTKDMFAGGAAEELEPTQDTRGTTIKINIRDEDTFSLLLKNFPHWCRDVRGLTALAEPDGGILGQGGTQTTESIPNLPLPDWVDRAHLSPVWGISAWDAMTGTSLISVLYRGVFVQDYSVDGLWGIQGSVDVDPKKFKPRLNRESFIESEFPTEIERFLRQSHPTILLEMATRLADALKTGHLDKWTEKRWATLWLSVPREEPYAAASREWDRIFRTVPAFELAVGNKWEPISLDSLVGLSSPVFVAPYPGEKSSDVVNAALRLLRNSGSNVIRGLRRESGFLGKAGNYFTTTADLIVAVFANELPELTPLAPIAEETLANVGSMVTLFDGTPSVDLVKLGDDSPPVLKLQSRLVLNIDHPVGKTIIDEALTENSGPWSLIAITARHSHENLSQVAAAVRHSARAPAKLGLVKRRFIRGLLQ